MRDAKPIEAQPPMDTAVAEPSAKPAMAFARLIFSPLVCYVTSVVICLVVVVISLELWRADLHIPFAYSPNGNDSFVQMMLTKTIIETGWINHNPHLGAPGSFDFSDYPIPETLHWGIIRLLSVWSNDFAKVINGYYLLAFPLVTLTSMFAARSVGLKPSTSILVSELFTFLPYHFMRGEIHLALGAYYAIPLTIPPILALAAGRRLFTRMRPGALGRLGRPGILALIAVVLVALSSPYYAVFTSFFLILAPLIALARYRRRALPAVAESGVLLAVLGFTFFVQVVPNLLENFELGPNPMAVRRLTSDGDTYALKIAQLLLPIPEHRISMLASLRDSYGKSFSRVNENEDASLGIVGAIGFLYLLAHGLLSRLGPESSSSPRKDRAPSHHMDSLAIFVVAGLLLASVGGFGSTAMFLGFKFIRAYNRISVFLAFFSLLAVGIQIERLAGLLDRGHRPWARGIASATLLLVGLLDQTSAAFVPTYDQNARDFKNDSNFVASIESELPSGSAVFQFPPVRFPESPSVYKLADYQLFRGYLHSVNLRWSYGAMKGRRADIWQQQVLQQPLKNALLDIRDSGFAGVYLDRRGFEDRTIENEMVKLLGKRVVSGDRNLVFFHLGKNLD